MVMLLHLMSYTFYFTISSQNTSMYNVYIHEVLSNFPGEGVLVCSSDYGASLFHRDKGNHTRANQNSLQQVCYLYEGEPMYMCSYKNTHVVQSIVCAVCVSVCTGFSAVCCRVVERSCWNVERSGLLNCRKELQKG